MGDQTLVQVVLKAVYMRTGSKYSTISVHFKCCVRIATQAVSKIENRCYQSFRIIESWNQRSNYINDVTEENQRREDLRRGMRRESGLQVNKIMTMKMMRTWHCEWGNAGRPFHRSFARARAWTERHSFCLWNLVIVKSHASQAIFTCVN